MAMAKVLIVYATDYGNTKKMAEAIAEGVKTANSEALVHDAQEVKQEDLLASNALILGSPVHMGSPDWRVKKFIDTVCSSLWMRNALNGKVAGVFATGGGYGSAGGGCELTMLALLNNLAELGMILIPLPKNTPGYRVGGLQWGPYARSMGLDMEPVGISQEGLEAAHHHGANIARYATELQGKYLFAATESVKK